MQTKVSPIVALNFAWAFLRFRNIGEAGSSARQAGSAPIYLVWKPAAYRRHKEPYGLYYVTGITANIFVVAVVGFVYPGKQRRKRNRRANFYFLQLVYLLLMHLHETARKFLKMRVQSTLTFYVVPFWVETCDIGRKYRDHYFHAETENYCGRRRLAYRTAFQQVSSHPSRIRNFYQLKVSNIHRIFYISEHCKEDFGEIWPAGQKRKYKFRNSVSKLLLFLV